LRAATKLPAVGVGGVVTAAGVVTWFKFAAVIRAGLAGSRSGTQGRGPPATGWDDWSWDCSAGRRHTEAQEWVWARAAGKRLRRGRSCRAPGLLVIGQVAAELARAVWWSPESVDGHG
jgi:hypothetical protein